MAHSVVRDRTRGLSLLDHDPIGLGVCRSICRSIVESTGEGLGQPLTFFSLT
jgi:hypothetical protein